MKNSLIFLSIVIFFGNHYLFSQKTKFVSDTLNEYLYREGNVIEDNFPLEGKCEGKKVEKKFYKTGKWTYYYINGAIAVEGEYNRDNEIGEWKGYYPNGILYYSGSYKQESVWPENCYDGVEFVSHAVGIWTIYTEDGIAATQYDFGTDCKLVEWKTLSTVYKNNYEYGDGNTGEGEAVLSSVEFIRGYEMYTVDHIKSIENQGSFMRTGVWKAYNSSGVLLSEITYDYKTNRPSGLCKFYHDNGKVKSMGNLQNQSSEGEWKYYNSEGVLTAIKTYVNDSLNGKCQYYYANGKLQSETFYLKGLLSGQAVYYFDNGFIKAKGLYLNGKKSGTWLYFFKDGNKKQESYYVNDALNGIVTNFHKNGTVQSTLKYDEKGNLVSPISCFDKNGIQILKDGSGMLIELDVEGNITMKSLYRNGCRDGLTTWYYANGQIDSEILYKYDPSSAPFGLRWESVSSFNSDGTPRAKGTLTGGNGTIISYDENGKVVSEKKYVNGIISN